MKFTMLDNEYWWGGCVNLGHKMPFSAKSSFEFNLTSGRENDQFAPLLISSKGRYIWCDGIFDCHICDGVIDIKTDAAVELCDGFENLRGAYLAASKKHFPFDASMPDILFWSAPQYNTWMELGTEQTTENILEYARGIKSNGLPSGILMIDGGWQEDYGVYEYFNQRKIPDPKALVDELHGLGFKVMVWVSPIVSSAGTRYKELRDRGYLVSGTDGEPVVRKWWSGYSAVLDFSNPDAVAWMREKLNSLMVNYRVDGFKFDAGDRYFYDDDDITYGKVCARDQTALFNAVGEVYRFNEFRAAWKFGGRPIVARLHDKYHSWDSFGINTLVPHTVLQGLLGYAYCCPDMVGGGIIGSTDNLDEELFVRWAQANALMGMMQMSKSPWKILSAENVRRVKAAYALHIKYSDYICSLAKKASQSGEPVVRHMCYEFPNEGFEEEDGQFMLGSDILVAPVLKKGERSKTVRLPGGKWRYFDGTVFDGSTCVEVDADLDVLPYFEKMIKNT